MKSAHFDEKMRTLKEEAPVLGLIALLLLVILKIAFYRENLVEIVRLVFSLIWLFVIPGYVIMLRWVEKIGLLERLVMGSLLSAGVTGIVSYYVGLIGFHIKFHVIFLPIILVLCGLLGFFFWNEKNKESDDEVLKN